MEAQTSKLLYSATMSLDGYIAGVGGDMSWLTEHLQDPNPEADALLTEIGALLVGNNTYGGDDPNAGTDEEGAFGGRWSGPSIVLTHDPGKADPGHRHDADGGLGEAVAARCCRREVRQRFGRERRPAMHRGGRAR